MPRYFFNLRRDHLSICDARGEECSRPVDAVEHAFIAALTLMSRQGFVRTWTGWAVEVEDETRKRVATIPFALALQTDSAAAARALDHLLHAGAH